MPPPSYLQYFETASDDCERDTEVALKALSFASGGLVTDTPNQLIKE